MLALLAQVAHLQRHGVRQRIFGGQVPLLNIGRLNILRIHVKRAAVADCAAGKALLGGARLAGIAGVGVTVVTFTAWMNGVIEVRRWLDELPSKKLVAP